MIWLTLENSLAAPSDVTDLFILYASIEWFYFPLLQCFRENRVIPLLWSLFRGRHYVDFSVFWILSTAELHCCCFCCLGFVQCLLTRTFPVEPSFKAEAIVWAFWGVFLVNHGPFPKLRKTFADQQFMKSSRLATSFPLVGKCAPGRLTPHFCFFFFWF